MLIYFGSWPSDRTQKVSYCDGSTKSKKKNDQNKKHMEHFDFYRWENENAVWTAIGHGVDEAWPKPETLSNKMFTFFFFLIIWSVNVLLFFSGVMQTRPHDVFKLLIDW